MLSQSSRTLFKNHHRYVCETADISVQTNHRVCVDAGTQFNSLLADANHWFIPEAQSKKDLMLVSELHRVNLGYSPQQLHRKFTTGKRISLQTSLDKVDTLLIASIILGQKQYYDDQCDRKKQSRHSLNGCLNHFFTRQCLENNTTSPDSLRAKFFTGLSTFYPQCSRLQWFAHACGRHGGLDNPMNPHTLCDFLLHVLKCFMRIGGNADDNQYLMHEMDPTLSEEGLSFADIMVLFGTIECTLPVGVCINAASAAGTFLNSNDVLKVIHKIRSKSFNTTSMQSQQAKSGDDDVNNSILSITFDDFLDIIMLSFAEMCSKKISLIEETKDSLNSKLGYSKSQKLGTSHGNTVLSHSADSTASLTHSHALLGSGYGGNKCLGNSLQMKLKFMCQILTPDLNASDNLQFLIPLLDCVGPTMDELSTFVIDMAPTLRHDALVDDDITEINETSPKNFNARDCTDAYDILHHIFMHNSNCAPQHTKTKHSTLLFGHGDVNVPARENQYRRLSYDPVGLFDMSASMLTNMRINANKLKLLIQHQDWFKDCLSVDSCQRIFDGIDSFQRQLGHQNAEQYYRLGSESIGSNSPHLTAIIMSRSAPLEFTWSEVCCVYARIASELRIPFANLADPLKSVPPYHFKETRTVLKRAKSVFTTYAGKTKSGKQPLFLSVKRMVDLLVDSSVLNYGLVVDTTALLIELFKWLFDAPVIGKHTQTTDTMDDQNDKPNETIIFDKPTFCFFNRSSHVRPPLSGYGSNNDTRDNDTNILLRKNEIIGQDQKSGYSLLYQRISSLQIDFQRFKYVLQIVAKAKDCTHNSLMEMMLSHCEPKVNIYDAIIAQQDIQKEMNENKNLSLLHHASNIGNKNSSTDLKNLSQDNMMLMVNECFTEYCKVGSLHKCSVRQDMLRMGLGRFCLFLRHMQLLDHNDCSPDTFSTYNNSENLTHETYNAYKPPMWGSKALWLSDIYRIVCHVCQISLTNGIDSTINIQNKNGPGDGDHSNKNSVIGIASSNAGISTNNGVYISPLKDRPKFEAPRLPSGDITATTNTNSETGRRCIIAPVTSHTISPHSSKLTSCPRDRHIFKISIGFAEFCNALSHIANVFDLTHTELNARIAHLQCWKVKFLDQFRTARDVLQQMGNCAAVKDLAEIFKKFICSQQQQCQQGTGKIGIQRFIKTLLRVNLIGVNGILTKIQAKFIFGHASDSYLHNNDESSVAVLTEFIEENTTGKRTKKNAKKPKSKIQQQPRQQQKSPKNQATKD